MKHLHKRLSIIIVMAILLLLLTHGVKTTRATELNGHSILGADYPNEITEILNQMSLEDKIRQMFIVEMRSWRKAPEETEFDETMELNNEDESIQLGFTKVLPYPASTNNPQTPEYIFAHFHYGGLMLYPENIASIQDVTMLNFELQHINYETGGVLLLIGTTQEGGEMNSLPGTLLPGNLALAATGDPDNAYLSGRIIGEELAACGFNFDYAPVYNVISDAKHLGMDTRAFSDRPEVVQEYAGAFTEGLKEANIIALAKYLPNYQSDTSSPSEIITLLRNELNNDGLIATINLDDEAIRSHRSLLELATESIQAGAQLLLTPYDLSSPEMVHSQEQLVADLANEVKCGNISLSQIDESVARILKTKSQFGLLTQSFSESPNAFRAMVAKQVVGSAGHRAYESDMAEDAVTIYRGENFLPLDYHNQIIIGCASHGQSEIIKDVFQKANQPVTIYNLESPDEFSALESSLDGNTDILILTSQNLPYLIQNNQALVKYAKDQQIQTVIISTGYPADLLEYEDADIVLASYHPGTGFTGGPYPENLPATLRVLFGRASSLSAGNGSLPVSARH